MVRGVDEMSLNMRSRAMSMGWGGCISLKLGVYLKFSIAKKEEKGGIGENERGEGEGKGGEGEEKEEAERRWGGNED